MTRNVQRLIREKMATDAIPDGEGVEAGLRFLMSKENIAAGYKKAQEFVALAIQAVRSAAEPNPYRDADDETIAGALLEKIEQRKVIANKRRNQTT